MSVALDRFAPTFEPFSPTEYSPEIVRDSASWRNEPPHQAKGDFNGDGLQDLALNGHDKTRELLIVILSQPDSSYRVYPLKEIALAADKHFRMRLRRTAGSVLAAELRRYTATRIDHKHS